MGRRPDAPGVNLECPHCGNPNWIAFSTDSTGDFRMQMVVERFPCLTCGQLLHPGVVVEHSRERGRFHTVARPPSPIEVDAVTHILGDLKADPNVTAQEVADRLEGSGTALGAALAKWVRENGGWPSVLALIVAVLSLLHQVTADSGVSADQVARLIASVERTQPTDPRDHAGRDAHRRNDPCPCGSGRKWKHCHGAHPSLRDRQRPPAGSEQRSGPE